MTSDLTYLGLRIPKLYLKITVPASAFRTRIPFAGFEMYQVPITHLRPWLQAWANPIRERKRNLTSRKAESAVWGGGGIGAGWGGSSTVGSAGAVQARPELTPGPRNHPPLHSLGFQVDTTHVSAASVPRVLANVTEHFCPDPCSRGSSSRRSAAGWGGCHHAPAAGPRRGSRRGSRPGTPETPREKRGREALTRFPGVAQEQGRPGRLGPSGRAFPPRPPRGGRTKSERSWAPPPPPRGPAAPASRSRGGRRAPASRRGRRFVTSLVSQQARAARAPPTPGPPPRRLAAHRLAPLSALPLPPGPGLPRRRGASRPAARGCSRRGRRRAAGQHVRGPRLPAARNPRSDPAERSALLAAARCCAS